MAHANGGLVRIQGIPVRVVEGRRSLQIIEVEFEQVSGVVSDIRRAAAPVLKIGITIYQIFHQTIGAIQISRRDTVPALIFLDQIPTIPYAECAGAVRTNS